LQSARKLCVETRQTRIAGYADDDLLLGNGLLDPPAPGEDVGGNGVDVDVGLLHVGVANCAR